MAKHEFSESRFTHRPRKDQMPLKHPLIRVPPNGISGLTILSHDVVGTDTHYWHGRTQPCGDEECEACQDNNAPRWRGYLFVMSGKSERVGVIELTPAVMHTIDRAFRDRRTLRGSKLALSRRGGKTNGELHAEIGSKPNDTSYLPEAPSLKKFLAKLWDLKVVKTKTVTTDKTIKMRDENVRDVG